MTNRDCLIGRPVLLVVLLWCASIVPGSATTPQPSGNGLLKAGGGGRFSSYAAQVQSSIKDALLNNNKTRTVSISGVIVRIWVDNTARVTRVQLIGTTGQTSLDNVISDEVLKGLQLKAAPPSDMPMPIVLRLTIRNFSWYTAQVQSSIDEALLNNSKTKAALITGVLIRIWIDRAGRVTRAQLGSQSGDPSIDRVITDEVLVGLQLKEPPPSDMPMPIVLRVTLHRPS